MFKLVRDLVFDSNSSIECIDVVRPRLESLVESTLDAAVGCGNSNLALSILQVCSLCIMCYLMLPLAWRARMPTCPILRVCVLGPTPYGTA